MSLVEGVQMYGTCEIVLLLQHYNNGQQLFQIWGMHLVYKGLCLGSKIRCVTSGLWWVLLKTGFHCFL